MIRRLAAALALAASPAPALAQGRPALPPSQSQAMQGRVMTPTGFVVMAGRAAGAAAACEAPAATRLRLCVQRILPLWHSLNGQPDPTAAERQGLAGDWRDAFMGAYAMQSGPSPPATCQAVMREVSGLPLWRECGLQAAPSAPAPALPGAAGPRSAVPDGSPG